MRWLLSDEKASACLPTADGNTPLHHACQFGSVAMAEALLDAPGTKISAANEDGDTPFPLSCFGGHKPLCELLHSRGERPDQVNGTKCSGFLQACAAGQMEVAKWLLLKAPTMIDAPDEEGRSPLVHCCAQEHAELAEWLLQQGAVPTQDAARVAKGQHHISKILRRALRERGDAEPEEGSAGAAASSSGGKRRK